MKNTLGNIIGWIFLIVILFAVALHFFGKDVTPNVGAQDRINELESQLLEEQATWKKYAPLAQQGKLAERHMSLANKKANTIREELSILKGLTEGAK